MSRRPRIDVPGGTYYLVQVTHRHQTLFSTSDDYAHLESLLAGSVRRTHTKVFAYCWLPHALHLAVRTREIRVGRFMQGFTSGYARYVHAHSHERGHLFAQRFQSLLIDPNAWLPALVRYIHHAPVRANEATTPDDFPHSSHHAYAETASPAWLDRDTVRQLLHEQGLTTRLQQRAWLDTPPTAEELTLFGRNGTRHTRILGDAEFSQRLPRAHRPARSPATLTLMQLIEAIAIQQNATKEEILSLSRRRTSSLARALVAWHAVERRIATLGEVARLLQRDPSTLSKAVTRHRERHPALFRLDALTHLRSFQR